LSSEVLFQPVTVIRFGCGVVGQAGVPTPCSQRSIDFPNGVMDSSRHGSILRGVIFFGPLELFALLDIFGFLPLKVLEQFCVPNYVLDLAASPLPGPRPFSRLSTALSPRPSQTLREWMKYIRYSSMSPIDQSVTIPAPGRM